MVKLIALLSPMYVTLFWGISFFLKRAANNKATQMLTYFMFTAFLLYLSHLFYFIEQYELYSFFESVYITALLSLYPFFYFYVRSLSYVKEKKTFYLLHFVPALFLGTIALLLNFFISPSERIVYVKELLIERNLRGFTLHTVEGFKALIFLISRIIFIGHTIFYLILGIRLSNVHNKLISQYFSNLEKRSMNWIKNLSFFYLIASAAAIIFSVVGRSYFAQNSLMLIIPSVIFSSMYFVLGFLGNQHVLITEDIIENSPENIEHSVINQSDHEKLKKELLTLFEQEKIYMHPDLRITKIAEELQTNRTYISRMINEDFSMNFNDFVNQYRVREAEKLLVSEEYKAYTIDYIAETVGFGSGNSFSRAFKEYKGITPGQYRAKMKLRAEA